jgi:hypothetical protein
MASQPGSCSEAGTCSAQLDWVGGFLSLDWRTVEGSVLLICTAQGRVAPGALYLAAEALAALCSAAAAGMKQYAVV